MLRPPPLIITTMSKCAVFALGLFLSCLLITRADRVAPDPNGYIMFCPCMGRFGNQADHYLGALGFAKGLNRTLVLPPWVEYVAGRPKSIQVPFHNYFNVSILAQFHRVISMDQLFESGLAGQVWPEEKRFSFCYADRPGDLEPHGCNAKNGNPFGPFWDRFGVNFVGSVKYGPLHYDVHNTHVAEQWQRRFNAQDWPVLAFTGAPASFPVQPENIFIHQFLVWNDHWSSKANHFIRTRLPKGPFVGIHLRNGEDWERACQHVVTSPSLFAAVQCVGYRHEHGHATPEMCLPSKSQLLTQLRSTVTSKSAVAVFVASDSDHMISDITKALGPQVAVVKLDVDEPHLDLAILGRADHFIGNCISSFSAFVKRERDVRGLPSNFWSFPAFRQHHHHHQLPDEL